MKLKSSLRMIEFTALLAAAGMAQAAEAGLEPVMPGTSFATTVAAQQPEVFMDPHGFSLLTSGDGSLQHHLTSGGELAPLGGLAYGFFSGLTNTLVGSTYNALSKTFLYAGLVPSDRYFQSSGFARKGSDSSSTASGNNGKTTLMAVMSKPQSYAMFFAGLGIMGMVVRRRARSF